MIDYKLHCFQICNKNYHKCSYRKSVRKTCFKLRKLLEEEKKVKQQIFNNKIVEQFIDIPIGDDFFDSMGSDISKEEFFSNEMFFETR